MLVKCKTAACDKQKPRKYVLCSACWNKLPNNVRDRVRHGTEKGKHSLRATPEKGWLEDASRYVGKIKVPYIMGSGVTAVKIADDKSEV
jgi:hypothetical protein